MKINYLHKIALVTAAGAIVLVYVKCSSKTAYLVITDLPGKRSMNSQTILKRSYRQSYWHPHGCHRSSSAEQGFKGLINGQGSTLSY
jgi:hypothetical protein